MLARRILLNFFNLSAGELLSRVAAFLAFAHLARVLGTSSFGKIGFATTVVSYLALGVAQGFDAIGMREVNRNPRSLAQYTASILSIRLASAAVLYLLAAVVLTLLHIDPEVRVLLFLFALTLFSNAISLKWVFQASESSRPVAAYGIITQIVFAAGAFAVRAEREIYWVPLFQFLGELIAGSSLMLLFVRGHGRLRLIWDVPFSKRLLVDSFPLALSSLLGTVQYNFGVLALAFFSVSAMVGLYTAVSKLTFLFSVLLTLFQVSLFPTLARTGAGEHDLNAISHTVLKFMTAIFLPIALAFTVMAPRLLELLFGRAYRSGATTLQVLIWVLPFLGVRSFYRQILVAHRLQKYDLRAMMAGFVVNVGLNLALVPRFGAVGAAASVVASVAVVFAVAYHFVHRHVLAVPCLPHLPKPLVACGGMLAVATALARAPLAVQVVGAGLTYVSVFFAIRGTTLEELLAIRKGSGPAL